MKSLKSLVFLSLLIVFVCSSVMVARAQYGAGGLCNGVPCPPPCEAGSPYPCDRSQAAVIDVFAAFSINDGLVVRAVWGYHSKAEAENTALGECIRAGGQNCKVVIGAFGNMCGAVAMDPNGYFGAGFDYASGQADIKAMNACSANSQVGKCRLQSPAVCVGTRYPRNVNDHLSQSTGAQLEALSSKLDTRQYWGALADGPNASTGVYDQPSRDMAEQQALAKCAGCKILVTFENSCAAQSWPQDPGKSMFDETAVDVNPDAAKAKAKALCDGKYGNCKVGVRCSGRRYLRNNPDAPANPPNGTN